MNRLRRTRLYLVVLIVVLVCGFFVIWQLRLVNAFNPMLLAFLESFQIQNDSGELVEVIPIGMIEGSGRYDPLPRYKRSFPPAIPVAASKPITLELNMKANVTYDYDDINFRHLLIRDRVGNIYILDTDKKGTVSACYGPQKELYVIPKLDQLQLAPKELIPCFSGQRVFYSNAKEYP